MKFYARDIYSPLHCRVHRMRPKKWWEREHFTVQRTIDNRTLLDCDSREEAEATAAAVRAGLFEEYNDFSKPGDKRQT